MSLHFKKKVARVRQEIPTASMSDIVFILLIFFMVSTVLRETTLQVRTALPEAEAIAKLEQKRLVAHVFIGPRRLDANNLGETQIQIDDALVESVEDVSTILYARLMDEPRLIVSLRVDASSEMGVVLDVQEQLRAAGTLRINYSTEREAAP